MTLLLAGGGELHTDTLHLVQAARDQTGKSNPNLLIMPTPVTTPPNNNELFGLLGLFAPKFGETSHCAALTYDTQEWPTLDRARDLIPEADVLVMLGGNTTELVWRLKVTGIGDLLAPRVADGSLSVVGASAGMGYWLLQSATDTVKLGQKPNELYHWVEGSGIVPGRGCAHWGQAHSKTNQSRTGGFYDLMAEKYIGCVGVGVPKDANLVIDAEYMKVQLGPTGKPVQRLIKTGEGIDGITVTSHSDADGPITIAEFFGPPEPAETRPDASEKRPDPTA